MDMRAAKLLPAVVACCFAMGHARAATIEWSLGPSFNGATGYEGILTNGTLVEAVDLVGATGGSLTVDPLGINLTFSMVNSPFFNSNWASAGFGGSTDSAWGNILNTFEWHQGSDVAGTGFLGGLVAGHTYQVQFFAARSDCCGTRTLSFSNGIDVATVTIEYDDYVSVVGTFVADASSQTISFDDSTNNPLLNAYVLRDISPVPEPQTWTMLLAGLLTVAGVAAWRRPARAW
ncbi:MAG: PEP-CTERM sorting domain-containing protein [Pseudomonadota bacterium]